MQTTNPIADYWLDAWQRSILTLDVLRQRGNIYYEHNAMNAPNVLSFKGELVLDGRTLERPVNYVLARGSTTTNGRLAGSVGLSSSVTMRTST